MIIVDSSVWIDFCRGVETPQTNSAASWAAMRGVRRLTSVHDSRGRSRDGRPAAALAACREMRGWRKSRGRMWQERGLIRRRSAAPSPY